jgi:hypothetical protein
VNEQHDTIRRDAYGLVHIVKRVDAQPHVDPVRKVVHIYCEKTLLSRNIPKKLWPGFIAHQITTLVRARIGWDIEEYHLASVPSGAPFKCDNKTARQTAYEYRELLARKSLENILLKFSEQFFERLEASRKHIEHCHPCRIKIRMKAIPREHIVPLLSTA